MTLGNIQVMQTEEYSIDVDSAVFQDMAAAFRQAGDLQDYLEIPHSAIGGMLEDVLGLGAPHPFVGNLLPIYENAMTALVINPEPHRIVGALDLSV